MISNYQNLEKINLIKCNDVFKLIIQFFIEIILANFN